MVTDLAYHTEFDQQLNPFDGEFEAVGFTAPEDFDFSTQNEDFISGGKY